MFFWFSGIVGGQHRSGSLRAGGPRTCSGRSTRADLMQSSPTAHLVLSSTCFLVSVPCFWGV